MEIQLRTYIRLAVHAAIFIVGFLGNLLTIIVICRRGQNMSAYQVLVLNLAISDFLFLISFLPLTSYELFVVIEKSEIFCRFIWPMFTILYLLSIFTITSMALQRCRTVVFPHRPKLSQQKAFIWVITVWLAAFIIVLPLAIVTKSVPPGECLEYWPSSRHKQAYTLALFLLQYFIPLVIITVVYARISHFLLHMGDFRRRNGSFATEEQRAAEARRIKRRNQALRTLAAVVILFAICLFPGQIAWLLSDFGNGGKSQKNAIHTLFKISDVLDNFHACINPVIYCLLSTRYRKEYFKCLLLLFRKSGGN